MKALNSMRIRRSSWDKRHVLYLGSWYSLFVREYILEKKTTFFKDPESGEMIDLIARAEEALRIVDDYRTVHKETGTFGYKAYSKLHGHTESGKGIWGEGTAGVILARIASGDIRQGISDTVELLKIQTPKGIPYVTISDPHHEMQAWPSVASTAWTILAVSPNGHNGVYQNIVEPHSIRDT